MAVLPAPGPQSPVRAAGLRSGFPGTELGVAAGGWPWGHQQPRGLLTFRGFAEGPTGLHAQGLGAGRGHAALSLWDPASDGLAVRGPAEHAGLPEESCVPRPHTASHTVVVYPLTD